jgi:glutamate synthase (NADPH/NADH) small chain
VEVLCAGECVYNAWNRPPINIGRLQRYATETALRDRPLNSIYKAKPPTGKRVALVGAGPASIAAAGLLALEGHRAVIIERKVIPGGLNSLGIAPYKMLGSDSVAEIRRILTLGDIELRTGVEITPTASGPHQISPETLLREYDAVFLGLGLGDDSSLAEVPPGRGVIGAVDLIERIKSKQAVPEIEDVKRALVIGGGNTAIDIAHELALLGVPNVWMVYRRTAKDMSGYDHEMDYARRHGVSLIENCAPTGVARSEDGRVVGLKARNTDGFNTILPAELVVLAIGQSRMTVLAKSFPGVTTDEQGRVVVDPATHRTANPKIWSGGDCVNGGKEVVNAVAEAKVAVKDIHRSLMENHRG